MKQINPLWAIKQFIYVKLPYLLSQLIDLVAINCNNWHHTYTCTHTYSMSDLHEKCCKLSFYVNSEIWQAYSSLKTMILSHLKLSLIAVLYLSLAPAFFFKTKAQ